MTIQTLNRSQLAHKYDMSYYYEKSVINVYFCFNLLSGYKYLYLKIIPVLHKNTVN